MNNFINHAKQLAHKLCVFNRLSSSFLITKTVKKKKKIQINPTQHNLNPTTIVTTDNVVQNAFANLE